MTSVSSNPTSTSATFMTPRELCDSANARMQEKYVIEKYKAMVEIAVKEVDKDFKDYEKNPEKHPKYSEEWKSFWSRRYKELIAQGKDANGHDYKPEWIEFWTKRMKDLHKKSVEKIRADARKKLGLSSDAVKHIDSPKVVKERRSRSRSRSPRNPRHRKRNDSPIKISDSDDDERPRRKKSRFESVRKSEERSRSRFSEDSPYSRHSDYRSKDTYDSTYYRDREFDRKGRSRSLEIEDGPITLVSVCRLLSALESELGIMAKKIIDLLAKALELERAQPNSADELLLSNSEHCNVLETVKEKLKGVLSANLISPKKISAVKRAVQNISILLHEVGKRKPSEANANILRNFKNSSVKSEEPIDPVAAAKIEIAKVITQSLLEQGRTNVTPEELEALIENFMESADPEELESEPEEVIIKPEVKIEVKPEVAAKKKETTGSGLENLTDEDLKTLLRNFADLTSDEQSHLIAYLSKIEQTNPARVEKLRKYVNIGDNDDNDPDFDGMDVSSGIKEPTPKTKPKSPEPVKLNLSDDDYDDDLMAKQLGMNGARMGESSKSKVPINVPSQSSALKDNSGLADSLMSSLMQSSMPVEPKPWEMGMQGGVHGIGGGVQGVPAVDMSAFYQQPMMDFYQMPQGMQMNYPLSMDALSMQQMGMQQMNMQMQNQNGQWPQNAASNFFQEMPNIHGNNHNNNHNNHNNQNMQDNKVPYRKRYEQQNNRQLTGKGKQRR